MSSHHHNTQLALHLAENVREENETTSPIASPSSAIGPLIDMDLDDHRHQLSVPRHGGSGSRTRRGTALSHGSARPEIPEPSILEGGTIARDFENAIVDDTASMTDGAADAPPVIIVPPGRRTTFRRSRRNRSRESSSSSDSSPSPPNSIHAFAERRRRHRSNTANTAERPVRANTASSAEGLPRRRLTFTEGPVTDDNASASTDASAENDVCYPQEDQLSDEPDIDYEELEEFVAEAEAETPGLIAPTTPATIPLEAIDKERPLHLPSPTIKPQDEYDDFAELEKVKDEARRTPQPGAEVVRPFYTFFTTEGEETIHATSLGGLLTEDETFKDLFSVKDEEEGVWWLDVCRPSEDEVNVLCKAFGVHPLTREDINTQESREKVELFRHYYFLAFRSFDNDKTDNENYLEPINVYAVVFRHGIMTFSHNSHNHAGNVLRRISKLRDYMSISADWMCYALIDDIVDGFMPAIHDVEVEVDTIEDSVFSSREEDARTVLARIGESRKRVMTLLRLLGTKSDVVKGFAKRCNENFSIAPTGDVGIYLSDIQDHIITMRDNLSHSEQLLSRVHTNFLAQINVDNIEGGNKTNSMLGKVTLLATILVPMNIITGLFGMNVEVPGKNTNNLIWFFSIIGVILAFCCFCVLMFKRFKLI